MGAGRFEFVGPERQLGVRRNEEESLGPALIARHRGNVLRSTLMDPGGLEGVGGGLGGVLELVG